MQDGSFLPKDRLHKTSYTPVALKLASQYLQSYFEGNLAVQANKIANVEKQ